MRILLAIALFAASSISLPSIAHATCSPTLCPPSAEYSLILMTSSAAGATVTVIPGKYSNRSKCLDAGRAFVHNSFESIRCIPAPSLP